MRKSNLPLPSSPFFLFLILLLSLIFAQAGREENEKEDEEEEDDLWSELCRAVLNAGRFGVPALAGGALDSCVLRGFDALPPKGGTPNRDRSCPAKVKLFHRHSPPNHP